MLHWEGYLLHNLAAFDGKLELSVSAPGALLARIMHYAQEQ